MQTNLSPRIFLITISCAIALTGCKEEEAQAEIVRPARVITVGDTSGIVERGFPGRAAATEEIELSFRVPGSLIQRPISVGDEVSAGQLVASLDPDTFTTEVERSQAEVAAAVAAVERTRLELERQEALLVEGWVTQSRVETVQAAHNNAKASLLAAEAGLKRAELDLGYTTLVAPFDGVVVDTYVENFQEVQVKQRVARIVDTSRIEFWVSLPEHLMPQLEFVENLAVEFDAFPGELLPAAVSEISNEASQTTRAFDVNLVMDQPEGFTVLPGMAGRATGQQSTGPTGDHAGYELPLSAIYNPSGEGNFVWVFDEANSVVSLREVVLGDTTRLGIRVTGVQPGEIVVTAGVEFLTDGQKVKALE